MAIEDMTFAARALIAQANAILAEPDHRNCAKLPLDKPPQTNWPGDVAAKRSTDIMLKSIALYEALRVYISDPSILSDVERKLETLEKLL